MTHPDFVQRFLDHHAVRRSVGPWCRADNDNAPLLFGTINGTRVRVLTATHAGRVGISEDVCSKSVRRYVRLRDLYDLLPTLYPARAEAVVVEDLPPPPLPATPATRDSGDILAWVARASGFSVDDLRGQSMCHRVVAARMVAYGMLHGEGKRSLPQIGAIMNRHHTTVLSGLCAIGLCGKTVSQFDRNFLRAIWAKGARPEGHGPGEVPGEVSARLGDLVVIAGGMVDAAARYKLLHWEDAACAA